MDEQWTCPFCRAKGTGMKSEAHHLRRHFWEWVRQETVAAQRDSHLWHCRLDNRRNRSERAFRGHMWHEHAAGWMEAWSAFT